MAGRIIALLLLFVYPSFSQTQPPVSESKEIAASKKLCQEEKWAVFLQTAPAPPDETADMAYCRGMALAKLKKLTEAQAAFVAGQRIAPNDKRFPEELAGIAWEQKDFARAKANLGRALQLDPHDDYATNFLASIYFLESNLEAVLKYWNRIGKPQLRDFSFQPEPELKPQLRDRAFRFSLGGVWERSEFLGEQVRAEQLGIFSRTQFDLAAKPDGSFGVTLRSEAKDPWRGRIWRGLFSMGRGLPIETIFPEFYNLNHAALNWKSLFRWDDEKRRVHSLLTTPLSDDPGWNFRIWFDARNENWDITHTLFAPTGPFASLNLEKAEAGVGLRSLAGGRFTWNTGLRYAYRRYRSLQGIPTAASGFFSDGSSLEYDAGAEYQALRLPEHRFTLTTSGEVRLGKTFVNSLGGYSRLAASVSARWFPRARGEDYETKVRIHAGRTFGSVPFDELFILGLERDNDLWLRGHIGTRGGKKGSAPLGRNYALFNSEVDKVVHQWPLFTWKIGPWLDAGEISDPSGIFGSHEWLWDIGAQTKLRVFGRFEVAFTYGRDLRGGRNSLYFYTPR